MNTNAQKPCWSISIIAACWIVATVDSFSYPQFSRHSGSAARRRLNLNLNPMTMTALRNNNDGNNELNYGIGGQNLSQRWIELVRDGHVTATTVLTDDDDDDGGSGSRLPVTVRYGVRLEEQGPSKSKQQRLLEFVEMISSQEDDTSSSSSSKQLRDRISSINATLTEMQEQSSSNEQKGNEQNNNNNSNNNELAIQCVYEGPYAAQLQLVRTLRPPRSREMSSNPTDEKISCQPPPYDSSNDSFLVGSLRLFGRAGESFHGDDGVPRERAGQLLVNRDRDGTSSKQDDFAFWDVFHNVSPVDPRGHFLLLPAIDDVKEWRDQSLSTTDCYDITDLASTIDPPGSMMLSFNSVGAGASQNHIHCHAWVCPPPPLLGRTSSSITEDTPSTSTAFYAVTKAPAAFSLHLPNGGVTVSLLDYPCTCIKLCATQAAAITTSNRSEAGNTHSFDFLNEMGEALSRIVTIAQEMEAPHNVAWTNNSNDGPLPETANDLIEAYVFFRRAELTSIDTVVGDFRLGASEMLGLFHSSSREQLESLENNMGGILSDVSWEPRQFVWDEVWKAFEFDTS